MADAKHRSDIVPLCGSDRLRTRILRPVGRGAALWPRLPALALVQLLSFIRQTLAPLYMQPSPYRYQKPMWFVANRAPVAYLNVAKAASSALSAAVQNETDKSSAVRQWRLRPAQRSHFKFAFVRDPFARLASCYMNLVKVKSRRVTTFNPYLWGALRLDLGFDVFARAVCQIPDALADRHFLSQSRQLFPGGEPLVDFVGRFERLEEQFEPLRRRYGLAALRRMNASPGYDYRKLYTEELVELVARRYAEDIERFGYQDARRELLRHARARRPAAARGGESAPAGPAPASRADRLRARILRPVGRGAALWPRLPALALVQLPARLGEALSPQLRGRRGAEWQLAGHAPVACLKIPNAASPAVAAAVHRIEADIGEADAEEALRRSRRPRLPAGERSRFKFAFVRDPFARLASLYMRTVARESPSPEFTHYLWGALRLDLGFDAFARTVCQIPDALADRRVRSQSRLVCPRGEPLVDFVGRFERLEEQFEPLRRRYGLAPLRRADAGADRDYRELYTEELVELVARRYAEDIERFGYRDARRELLRHAGARRAECA